MPFTFCVSHLMTLSLGQFIFLKEK
jgi:hypothetical protein